MNSNHIFWPVLAQVFLTLIMLIVLGARKTKAVKAGEVSRKQAALNNRVWPEDVVKVSNNIANQFEVPVLFYVLCLVLYSINAAGVVALVLAWLFVVSRFAHAYVHIGSNYVPMRFRLYLVGCLVLIAMLILVAWKLATLGPLASN
ncbi:MAG: MAPEG family protein [Oceanospirillales bacterium]|nr:MAPEG family protein [Oceanospirillales bacterium]